MKQLIDVTHVTVGFVCFVQEQCAVIYFVYIEDINITAEAWFLSERRRGHQAQSLVERRRKR